VAAIFPLASCIIFAAGGTPAAEDDTISRYEDLPYKNGVPGTP
jgi:hypothetical protein